MAAGVRVVSVAVVEAGERASPTSIERADTMVLV